jgi:hypothetical protein
MYIYVYIQMDSKLTLSLKEYFPADIVKYCIQPYLMISEQEVRQNHAQVMEFIISWMGVGRNFENWSKKGKDQWQYEFCQHKDCQKEYYALYMRYITKAVNRIKINRNGREESYHYSSEMCKFRCKKLALKKGA